MKKYLILGALLMTSQLCLGQDLAQNIVIDGEKYHEAYHAENDNVVMKEYVRKGESFKNWNKMVTILKYKNANDVKTVFRDYMILIKPNRVGKVSLYQKPKSKYKQVYISSFYLNGGSYLEFNVNKMLQTKQNKVYSVIFATKVPVTENSKTMKKRLSMTNKKENSWIEQLDKIDVANY